MSEAVVPLSKGPSGWIHSLQARLSGENAGEVTALYAVHFATIATPLAIVPYASRVLGPENWGVYSIFHSLALYASMLIEYGFNLSATRQAARLRESRAGRARLISDVFAAKSLLAIGTILVLAAAALAFPMLGAHPLLLAGAAIFALGQGAGMVWYFQGTAQVRRIAGVEIGGRFLAIGLSLAFVHESADAWLLLAVNGLALALVAAFSAAIAIDDCGTSPFSLSAAVRMLREGFSLFVFRGAVSLYTLANAFVLGLLAPPAAVGFYAGAERISKGFLGFLNPIIQANYARLSRDAASDPAAFAAHRRRCLVGISAVGLALGTVVFLAAPLLVRIVLGPDFERSVNLLRILALLAPVTALNSTLGVHGLLPLGRDRAFNTVIVAAGLLNLLLAFLLASRWQDTGMAAAVVTTESFVAAGFYLYLRREGLSPLRTRPATEPV